jgi:hypothetical protein
MFIGHFALGLAAKRAAPGVPLGVLFLAAQFADTLWPLFVMAGLERFRIDPGNTAFTPLDFVSYPYSHSLVMLAVWGALLGWVYRGADRRAFSVIAALVVSHWALDVVTHRPDMPIYPGGSKVGLGLWNSIPLTLLVEVPMFAAGAWIYLRATRARDAAGRWGFAALVVILLLIYAANAAGPPPPSVAAVSIIAFAGAILFTAWGWWADRHRQSL